MMLSEAIRLGAAKRPQAFSDYFDVRNDGSCALGAAFEGYTGHWHSERSIRSVLVEAFPASDIAPPPCPQCSDRASQSLLSLIAHLNDGHRWTREAIADWVQGVEEGTA